MMKSPYVEDKFDIDVYGVDLLEQVCPMIKCVCNVLNLTLLFGMTQFLHCHGEQLSQIPLRGSYGDRYYPSSFEAKPKVLSRLQKYKS